MINPFRLTIVIATVGRPSLHNTLESLVGQDLWPDDSIVVLNDGCDPLTHDVVSRFSLPINVINVFGPNQDWGHTPRNRFLRYELELYPISGYLLHIDDDDAYIPGAIATIRRRICANPNKILVWRQKDPEGNLVWHTPGVLSFANVSTATFSHPVFSTYPSIWTPKVGGDFEFIQALASTMMQNDPEPVVWLDEVLVNYRFSPSKL